jgi:hypothetical protein
MHVEAADREVRRAGEDLHRFDAALLDQDLVVGVAREVADLHVRRASRGGDPGQRFDLARRMSRMSGDVAGGVVEIEAETRTEACDGSDEVGLVEVVGEDVETQLRIGDGLLDQLEGSWPRRSGWSPGRSSPRGCPAPGAGAGGVGEESEESGPGEREGKR